MDLSIFARAHLLLTRCHLKQNPWAAGIFVLRQSAVSSNESGREVQPGKLGKRHTGRLFLIQHNRFAHKRASRQLPRNAGGFARRELDTSGLYFMRARYYNPLLSRFISSDPIGFGGGQANFFAYALNSPTNFVDPLGLSGSSGGGPGCDGCYGNQNRKHSKRGGGPLPPGYPKLNPPNGTIQGSPSAVSIRPPASPAQGLTIGQGATIPGVIGASTGAGFILGGITAASSETLVSAAVLEYGAEGVVIVVLGGGLVGAVIVGGAVTFAVVSYYEAGGTTNPMPDTDLIF